MLAEAATGADAASLTRADAPRWRGSRILRRMLAMISGPSDGSTKAAVVSGAEGWRRQAASQGFRLADNPAVQQGHRQGPEAGLGAHRIASSGERSGKRSLGVGLPDVRTRHNRY